MKTIMFIAVLSALYSVCLCAPAVSVDNSETNEICAILLAHPPHANLVRFNPVSDVRGLRKSSLDQLYRASLELLQGVGILKQELGCRISESIPPVHHHCFLEERSAEDFIFNSTGLLMDANRLAADLCLLTPFVAPLENALCYEIFNRSSEFEADIRMIQNQFSAILEAISNVTGVPLNTTDSPDTTSLPITEEQLDSSSRSPSVSRSHRDTRQALSNNLPSPSVPTTQAPSSPTSSSDYDLLNQRPRPRRQAPAAESATTEATPTSSNDKCSTPESDDYQFITVFELYTTVWYLATDLIKMT